MQPESDGRLQSASRGAHERLDLIGVARRASKYAEVLPLALDERNIGEDRRDFAESPGLRIARHADDFGKMRRLATLDPQHLSNRFFSGPQSPRRRLADHYDLRPGSRLLFGELSTARKLNAAGRKEAGRG